MPWGLVLYRTFVPNFSLTKDYVVTVVAVLGTTITPYCFFWQSSQEAQEERLDPSTQALIATPEEAPAQISRMRFDTYVGMGYSNLISLFIIVSAAATLNAHGVTNIQSSAQAAEALRPIAGVLTFGLFAFGIIGIGLLSVPVLAGSGAYALGEALGWTTGLDRKPLDAKAFYGTIAVSTLIGVVINFVGLDPIKALFWSAVINGVVAAPLMADHHAHGDAPRRDGSASAAAGAAGHGVAVYGRYDSRRGAHVRDLVIRSGASPRLLLSRRRPFGRRSLRPIARRRRPGTPVALAMAVPAGVGALFGTIV